MTVFNHHDYKSFLRDWMASRPRNGYGQMGQIAKHLNVSSVSVSHVFNSERNFSEEQAVELAEYMGLTDSESDYFLLLVQYARAGSKKLEKKYLRQIEKLRAQARDLKKRVPDHPEMDESAKATFYSNWYYSGIRLLTDIEEYGTIDAISQYLGLSRTRVAEVIEFLIAHGLCLEKNGILRMGPQRTHLEADSPLVAAHHRNWRLKAAQRFETSHEDELFFTGPMTLSLETLAEVRHELANAISKVTKMIEPSPSEVLACMNVDLFRVVR